MPEINLLQRESKIPSVSTGVLSRVISRSVLVLLIISLLGYGLIYLLTYQSKNKLEDVTKQVESAKYNLSVNTDRNEVITRQAQLIELEKLVNNHLYWSYLLPELARVTLKSAKYSNITADSTGNLALTVTLPSYGDIEKFMQIFDLPEYNQQFSNVQIVGIGKSEKDSTLQTELRVKLNFDPAFIAGRM